MGLSDKDVIVLILALMNNYGAKRRIKREQMVHPSVAEKVLTFGTFVASRTSSKYSSKFN
jgi:hypothetical protein